MTERQSRVARRLQLSWRAAALVVAVVTGGLLIALASVVPFSSETARRKVIEGLSARLDAEVELAELRFQTAPAVSRGRCWPGDSSQRPARRAAVNLH